MNHVDCDGGESTIWDCQYTNPDYCPGWEGAGVECFNDGYWTASKIVIVSVSVTLTLICCLVICCCYGFRKNSKAEGHEHVEVNMGEVNLKETNTSLNSGTDKEGNTVSSGDVEKSGTGRNEGESEAGTAGASPAYEL